MDETTFVIFKVQFYFALEVWFSIYIYIYIAYLLFNIFSFKAKAYDEKISS